VATVEVNGIELYYEVHGDGPPLVLIPGLGSDVRLFAGVVSALSETHKVVSFDPRGGGKSGKPEMPYSIDDMADDAAALVDHLAIGPTTVLGYSLGGRIALSLVLNHVDLVRRLVLAATSARTPASRSFGWRWFVMDVVSRFPRPHAADPQPRSAFERQRQASRRFDCSARLGLISVPTLILHGRNDHMVPLALATELEAGIPDSQLVTVPGGHLALVTWQRRHLLHEVRAFAAT
jgi:3-oxoadipate enol-lactonase